MFLEGLAYIDEHFFKIYSKRYSNSQRLKEIDIFLLK